MKGAGVEEEDLRVLCEEGFRGERQRSAGVPGTGQNSMYYTKNCFYMPETDENNIYDMKQYFYMPGTGKNNIYYMKHYFYMPGTGKK